MAEKSGPSSRSKKKKKRNPPLEESPAKVPNIPFEEEFPLLGSQTTRSSNRGSGIQGQDVVWHATPEKATSQQPPLQSEHRRTVLEPPLLQSPKEVRQSPLNYSQIGSPSVPQLGIQQAHLRQVRNIPPTNSPHSHLRPSPRPQAYQPPIGSTQVYPQSVASPHVHASPPSVVSPHVHASPPPTVSPHVHASHPPTVSPHIHASPPPMGSPRLHASPVPVVSQHASLQVCPQMVSSKQISPSPVGSPQDLPQVTPTDNRQAFPNPDTPDEAVLPAHPSFHPRMNPASSNLPINLTFTDVRGRPDQPKAAAKKINERLSVIIDDLASTGKFVPVSIVKDFKEKLLNQCYHARCSVSPRDMKVFDEYSRLHGRITHLIQIFCWMSPITTLYELERALISSENVKSFQEFRIGPLIKHPLAAKYFQPPPHLQEIPEITAHQIQKTLMKFLDKGKKASRGEKQSVEEFLEFFARSMSKSSPHDLCVRITSFPLAIQVNLFVCYDFLAE